MIAAGAINAIGLQWPNYAPGPSPFHFGLVGDNRRFPRWSAHNPSAGVFLMLNAPAVAGYYNAFVAAAAWKAQGFDTLVNLSASYPPKWAVGNDAALGAWAVACVQQTGCAAVEVDNEPQGRITPSVMAHNTRVVKDALKAAGLKTLVIAPTCESICPQGTGVSFTLQFLAAPDGRGGFGRDSTDVLACHLYPHGMNGAPPPQCIYDQAEYFLQQVRAAGWTGSVWNTEAGREWSTGIPTFAQLPLAQTSIWIDALAVLPLIAGFDRTWLYAFDEGNMGWANSPDCLALSRQYQQRKMLEGDSIVSKVRNADYSFTLQMASGSTLTVA